MYKEIGTFIWHFVPQRAMWKDGELWTAVLGGLACYLWFNFDASIIPAIRSHFGDLLGVTSIIFGFALAALLFYIQAAGSWAREERVIRVADKIVDRHVWTIICLLSLIGYIVALWSLGKYVVSNPKTYLFLHAVLSFLLLYLAFQILNHTLTVWWSFRNRNRLSDTNQNDSSAEEKTS